MKSLEPSHQEPIAPPSKHLEIPLLRTPLWNQSLSIIMILAAMFTGSQWLEWYQFRAQQPWLAEAGFPQWPAGILWLVIFFVIFSIRWIIRRFPLAPIELGETFAYFPKSAESTQRIVCHYKDILAVHLLGRGEQQWLIIETQQRLIRLPIAVFATLEGPRQLLETLQSKLLAQPSHQARLTRYNEARLLVVARLQQRIIAIPALLLLGCIFWIAMYNKQALHHPIGVWRWGALLPTLVQQGQWYRIFVAPLLQLDWLEGLMHAAILWLLGGWLERALGPLRTAGLLLFTAACTMGAASFAPSLQIQHGPMPLTIAVVVACSLLRWHWRQQLPFTMQESTRFWLWMAAVWLIFSIPMAPFTLLSSILAGFCGMLWMAPLLLSKKTFPSMPTPGVQLFVLIGFGLFAVALGLAIVQAKQHPEEDYLPLAQHMLTTSAQQPRELNQWAWEMTQADMPPDDGFLALAAESMVPICQEHGDELMYWDTLAMVWLQQEKYEPALVLGVHNALRSHMQRTYVDQLATILLQSSFQGRKAVHLPEQTIELTAQGIQLSANIASPQNQLLALVQDRQRILGFAHVIPSEDSPYHCALSEQVAALLAQQQLFAYPLPMASMQIPGALQPMLQNPASKTESLPPGQCKIYWILPSVFQAT